MIGASKDTVVSRERGRNRLSMTFTRRIAVATGVDGDWRLKGVSVPMKRESPAEVKAAGFRDDRSKRDDEPLGLELEVVPGWAPGRSMDGPKPGVMAAAKDAVSDPGLHRDRGKSQGGFEGLVRPKG
jgi:hypothetical protein